MHKNLATAGTLALLISLIFPAAALAQGETPGAPSRIYGEIGAIQGTTLVVESRSGMEQRVRLDDDTSIRSLGGKIRALQDLSVGMKVAVFGRQQGEILFARLIVVRWSNLERRLLRFRGELISLEPARGSLTLKNRQGIQQSFVVTEQTKFHSRGDQVVSYEDLAIGQHLAAVTKADDEHELLHLILLPEIEVDRPRISLRLRGEVVSASSRDLVVETRRGERAEFVLNEDTHLRGASDEGLQVGDRVLVAGYQNDEGIKVAVVVLIRPKFDRDRLPGLRPEAAPPLPQ